MKSEKKMKSQKKKRGLKKMKSQKKKKKWKQKIFRTQKFPNSINVSVRQCQYQTMSGSS